MIKTNTNGVGDIIIISLLLILTSCSNKEMGDFNWGTGPGDRHKKALIDEVFED